LELIKIISLLTISSILIGFGLNRLLRKKVNFEISLFQSFITGLIIIYLLVLTGFRLNSIIQGLFFFSLAASAYFIFYFFKSKNIIFSPVRLFLVLLFLIIAYFISVNILNAILYEPIYAWDARSIWYLKSKQLFSANGLNESAGINNYNAVNFSHPEYPILIPALGALIVTYIGYWNEYLPKTNLLLLWIGVLLAFVSLKTMNIISRILIFISLMILSPYMLSIGYMDVWLGIYISLSVLFLVEYSRTFRSEYLLTSLSVLLFCNYIKQDAILLTFSILSSFILLLLFAKNNRFIRYTLFKSLKSLSLLFILVLPYLLWFYYRIKWDLTSSEFDFGKLTEFSAYNTTFSKEKLAQIYGTMIVPIKFVKIFSVIGLMAITGIIYAIFSKFNNAFIKNGILFSVFPLVTILLFAAGMHILYCLSTHELAWHLRTSADRLRIHLLFISVPAFYAALGFYFYFPFKKMKKLLKKKKGKPSKLHKPKKK